ncbi:uncharacterized protein LOC121523650 isoform X2 [Cheilinus undulatus]|uniref:uncharacterized protein LOC121523650 isoform X2 n=1 Tax=Cheilinus undulatus TaxID=241271 RepID=UPI001BD2EF1E|nr:uncharacterized protein LOC121523650 isoform X2 [Cheilinus undulatus]
MSEFQDLTGTNFQANIIAEEQLEQFLFSIHTVLDVRGGFLVSISEEVFPVELQQHSVSKEEAFTEPQERSSTLSQEMIEPLHIKDKPDELWSSEKGEQLQQLEETGISKFTFVPVSVKSDEDEEKPQSSQLHQKQTEQLEAGADGEDFRRPEEARCLDPNMEVNSESKVTSDDSSEAETDDSADWMETMEHGSHLNSLEEMKTKRGKGL